MKLVKYMHSGSANWCVSAVQGFTIGILMVPLATKLPTVGCKFCKQHRVLAKYQWGKIMSFKMAS